MSYNSFWRRLRRRYRSHLLMYAFVWLGTFIHYASMSATIITWLLPEWHGTPIANASRWTWLLLCTFYAVIATFFLALHWLFRFLDPEWLSYDQHQWIKYLFASPLWLSLTAIALAFGKVNLAVYIYCGMGGIAALLIRIHLRNWHALPPSLAASCLIAAVRLGNVPLVLIAVGITWVSNSNARIPWRRVLSQKLSRAKYLEMLEKRHQLSLPTSSDRTTYSIQFLKALCQLEEWDKADVEYQRLMRNPTFRKKEGRIWKARIALGRERYEEVITEILNAPQEEAAALRPLLARAYAAEGRKEEALCVAEEMAKGKDQNTQFVLGETYAALGLYERALACFERVSRTSNKGGVLYGIASMLIALKEDGEARPLLEQAISRVPYQEARYLRELAACNLRLGRDDAAREAGVFARRAEE